jgi:hypothetical protein
MTGAAPEAVVYRDVVLMFLESMREGKLLLAVDNDKPKPLGCTVSSVLGRVEAGLVSSCLFSAVFCPVSYPALLLSSCPIHASQSNHPRNVQALPQPTTETGENFS